MNYIAELTGGKAFYNGNDLQSAMGQAMDDSSFFYTIGYYVPNQNWDGKYHRIKVKVLRPGLSVRAKKGYFAEKTGPITPTLLQGRLKRAAWSPFESTGLEVSARIDRIASKPHLQNLLFAVDAAQLTFHLDADSLKDALDVLYVQRAKDGSSIVTEQQTINLTTTPQNLQILKARGLATEKQVELDPQTRALRVVIADRGAGLVGSVTLQLEQE